MTRVSNQFSLEVCACGIEENFKEGNQVTIDGSKCYLFLIARSQLKSTACRTSELLVLYSINFNGFVNGQPIVVGTGVTRVQIDTRCWFR